MSETVPMLSMMVGRVEFSIGYDEEKEKWIVWDDDSDHEFDSWEEAKESLVTRLGEIRAEATNAENWYDQLQKKQYFTQTG